MANLKVFVSSTCYDLNIVRSQLRNFIFGFGYDPIMSEYADVLYDPRIHTHTSCMQEVTNCDMLILIIGSRFGGKAIPRAVDTVDIEFVRERSKSTKILDDTTSISITQLEVIKAVEDGIPIFTFVEEKVMHDHLVYEKNKEKSFIDILEFPSFVEKPETAKYVFEFINFLRHRIENNSIVSFNKMEDIELYLRKQWSGLFQRLVNEQRFKKQEEIKIDYLANQIADIKTAIMTSISSSDLRETAKGAIKFRHLIEFFKQLGRANIHELLLSEQTFQELLSNIGIVDIVSGESTSNYPTTFLLLADRTFFELRYPMGYLKRLEANWTEFTRLTETSREAIINAIYDMDDRPSRLRYIAKPFDEVIANNEKVNRQQIEIELSDEL